MTSGPSYHRAKLTATDTGVIYLNENTLDGQRISSFPVVLLQGDAAFVVKVRLADDAPWAAYPGDGSSAAGEPILLRGRWHELRVEIAEGQILWFHGDQVPLAWS